MASGTSQSYLCYVVAPRSPDTRARWLTELSAMVMEARRLSQAYLSADTSGQSSLLEGSSPNGNGAVSGLVIPSKMSSVTAAALYPSGIFFDPALLELPKIGRIQPSALGSSSPGRSKLSCSGASVEPVVASMLDSLHLTANHTSTTTSV
ncbi:Kalirin [Fasciola gigantica]|uniref:Kalirin n=1 Tax=Fasciola gigantica TaxID=46835 RepID=A0A504YMF7_FASGI|nr:Kalirin [Fasciola gigantica]